MITILVVEDDENLNQIICSYLAKNNYSAKGCSNPVEAYDLLYGGTYDLLFYIPAPRDFKSTSLIRGKTWGEKMQSGGLIIFKSTSLIRGKTFWRLQPHTRLLPLNPLPSYEGRR